MSDDLVKFHTTSIQEGNNHYPVIKLPDGRLAQFNTPYRTGQAARRAAGVELKKLLTAANEALRAEGYGLEILSDEMKP